MDDTFPHRRRYAKACDACYRKKIKCVYMEPACELCAKTQQPCRFTRMEQPHPKKARRGKYLAALEDRMKQMESLLQQSGEKQPQENGQSEEVNPQMVINEPPAIITRRDAVPVSEGLSDKGELQFPPTDQALRLAQGYFAACNYISPIFSGREFLERMGSEYPPDKHHDIVWWSSVIAVLCYAHRLRAMSCPAQADDENNEACKYLRQLLDIAPKLSYGKASIESAQVLLGVASIFRGTAMPDAAPMLVAVAIRMLQSLNAHREELPDTPEYSSRRKRQRVFWAAYILDKDIALTIRRPPVLSEADINRLPPPDFHEDEAGVIRSLDYSSEVNLFTASQRLAAIQGQVWKRVYSTAITASRSVLQAAQSELNPSLMAWQSSLPFRFNKEDLVARWPKHAIVHISILHFRYFNTLIHLNKEPPNEQECINPLKGDCPVAKSLPSYPHSTALIAVEAARDSLDLASLTPRGNFQNVWLFFEYSISAVLTLLVNGIVRPFNEHAADDFRRVNTWLRVIDILATSSERADLLQKKDFLTKMRDWTIKVMEGQLVGIEPECFTRQTQAYLETIGASNQNENGVILGMPELDDYNPDIFPLDRIYAGHPAESWANHTSVADLDLMVPFIHNPLPCTASRE